MQRQRYRGVESDFISPIRTAEWLFILTCWYQNYSNVNCPTNVISAFDKPCIPIKTCRKILFTSQNGLNVSTRLLGFMVFNATFSNIIPPLIEWVWVGAILQSSCPSVRPSVHTFVTDISASTGRNDFIFDIWLWHGDLYHVSPFQVYRTSTSCLQCDLKIFMFAVMKTFVTVISASTGRNDFIFVIWLWHGDLYRVSPFHVYRTSTSCLPCDLQMNEWGYS
jgi:hypothetical protein